MIHRAVLYVLQEFRLRKYPAASVASPPINDEEINCGGIGPILPQYVLRHLFEGVEVDQVLHDGGEAVVVRELVQAEAADAAGGEDDWIVRQIGIVVRVEAALVYVPFLVVISPARSIT